MTEVRANCFTRGMGPTEQYAVEVIWQAQCYAAKGKQDPCPVCCSLICGHRYPN